MNVQFLNPFSTETGLEMQRGELKLDKEPYMTDDVTVVISLIGRVEGNVFYSMDQRTALELASQMLGEQLQKFDTLAQSGIAELGNVITGQASIKLSAAGYDFSISPPTLLLGKGATISTLDYPRLIVPIYAPGSAIMIHLALRETTNTKFSTAQTVNKSYPQSRGASAERQRSPAAPAQEQPDFHPPFTGALDKFY